MVSFQCEACGDVVGKKKLDPHRGQCQGASYTCLDCMTHFEGMGYRAHMSCISEEQKYQGTLYKQKPSKKSVKIAPIESSISRAAYVEDAPDPDTGNGIVIVEPPPEAPVPPPAVLEQPNVNVFDFLVTDETPNASRVSLVPGGQNGMDYTPSVIGSEISRKKSSTVHDPQYEKHGFSYGTEALPATHKKENAHFEYITPASKELRKQLEKTEGRSTDKKRKRLQVEELDLSVARRPSQESSDAIMSDAPPAVLHSGLTGGLNRLLSKSKFPPSPDYSNDPPSPVKRSKSASTSQALVKKDRDRDHSKSTARSTSNALVKVRKRRTSDESRPRKKKRHHTSHNDDESSTHRRKKHRPKAIEYPSSQAPEDSQQQLVVFKTRAEFFMSLVTKGEESERGMSMHKVLKRYHRERAEAVKEEEEKELFKRLRLRKNERGEIVVFWE